MFQTSVQPVASLVGIDTRVLQEITVELEALAYLWGQHPDQS